MNATAFRSVLLSAASLLFLAGCSKLRPCVNDAQCDKGVLPQGVCTEACVPACGAEEVCDRGTCFPKDCPGLRCPENAFCHAGRCTFHGCRDRVCGEDQLCVEGGACVSTWCKATRCAEGEVCGSGGACIEDACYNKKCSAGQVCYFGRCHDRDCHGRSCGSSFCDEEGVYCKDCPGEACEGDDALCIEGTCQSRTCLTDPSSPACQNGCKEQGRTCRPGEVCVGSTCVLKDCPDRTCPVGSFCAGSRRLPNACIGVTCRPLNEPCGGEGEPACQDQRCAADGLCYPLACGGQPCPDGQVCKDEVCQPAMCVGIRCDPGWVCWAGGCYSTTGCPEGQIDIHGSCQSPGPHNCGAFPCPSGYECLGGACVDGKCTAGPPPTCPPPRLCAAGTCHPNGDPANPDGGTCLAGEAWIAGRCVRLQNADGGVPLPCGDTFCPAGYACQNERCVDVRCLDRQCPPREECKDGLCYPITAPDGGLCPPGTVWTGAACEAETPFVSCCEGTLRQADGSCMPPQLPAGSCATPCGQPHCGTCCAGAETCDRSGACLPACESCPEGFVCASTGAPPCVPSGCAAVSCPPGTHCVDTDFRGPRCEPTQCDPPGEEGTGETCDPNESCENGTCTDMICRQINCPPGRVCFHGDCYEECCREGGFVIGECLPGCTMCYVPPGSEGPGIPATVGCDCGTESCSSGEMCRGDRCVLGHGDPDCLPTPPTGLESPICNGRDDDCNGYVDDWEFFPSAGAGFRIYPKKTHDHDAPDSCRYPCSNTAGDDDWGVLGKFDEGANVFLRRGDYDYGDRDTHVPGGPKGVSSCIEIAMPCSRFMATRLYLKAHGTGHVPCARLSCKEPEGSMSCAEACERSKLLIYTRARQGDSWHLVHHFKPRLDANVTHKVNLSDDVRHPKQVQAVLLCRDMSSSVHATVAIDGVKVMGCCP